MVSDTYTLRYLVQETEAARISWRERSSGGFTAAVDAVKLLLQEIHTRSAVRLGLRFRHADDEFWLYSPLPTGWLGGSYASDEDRDLVELLQQLLRAVTLQCARREEYLAAHRQEVRSRIYGRLLFGERACDDVIETDYRGEARIPADPGSSLLQPSAPLFQRR